MQQQEPGGRMVKCAYPGCTRTFVLTKANAFQRFCPPHQEEARQNTLAKRRRAKKKPEKK